MHAESLTAALKSCGAAFSVRVVFFGLGAADAAEAGSGFAFRQPEEKVLLREVYLCLDEMPVVSARSLCLAGCTFWREVLDRGARSLGLTLFGGEMADLQRSGPVYFSLPPQNALVRPFSAVSLPARYSLFSVPQGQLLLTECFLPAAARFFPAA